MSHRSQHGRNRNLDVGYGRSKAFFLHRAHLWQSGNDLCMSNGAFELMTHIWHPEQFAEKVRVPFESLECLIPAKWDEVLTILFGKDYMTPPPESERVAKHLDV